MRCPHRQSAACAQDSAAQSRQPRSLRSWRAYRPTRTYGVPGIAIGSDAIRTAERSEMSLPGDYRERERESFELAQMMLQRGDRTIDAIPTSAQYSRSDGAQRLASATGEEMDGAAHPEVRARIAPYLGEMIRVSARDPLVKSDEFGVTAIDCGCGVRARAEPRLTRWRSFRAGDDSPLNRPTAIPWGSSSIRMLLVLDRNRAASSMRGSPSRLSATDRGAHL